MKNILALKNNEKDRKYLQSSMAETKPYQWLSATLQSLEKQAKEAPWKYLFLNYEEELRLMAQHPDSKLRYQACSILILSDSKTTRRILWDLFRDNHQEIRILMIQYFRSSDRQKLYNTLFRLYLRDPLFQVRKEALSRIRKDFSDLYTLNTENLEVEERIHCLELLDIHSAHDHNLALRLMDDPSPGIVLAASLYLEKTGTLDNLIKKASLKDEVDLDRRKKILISAAEHQVISFLMKKENLQGRASLFLAIEVFQKGMTSSLFPWVIEQVFGLKGSTPVVQELKEKALSCLIKRKDPESILLIKRFLQEKLEQPALMELLIENLPSEGNFQFYPILKTFLMDKDFPYWPSLVKSFEKMPLNLCLSDLYALVRDASLDKIIRKRAVLLLPRFGEFTSTLFILENLGLLDQDEMSDLALSIVRSQKSEFLKTAAFIFSEHDSALHQNLMRLASASGIQELIPVMEEKLVDADPMSRMVSLSCLKELDQRDSIPLMRGLLYDPDERVRREAASVFVDWNREETLSEVGKILQDKNESPSVLRAIIKALGLCKNSNVIPLLISLSEWQIELKDKILEALSLKQSREEMALIISHFASSSDQGREFLIEVFRAMGESIEEPLMDLLGSTQDQTLKESIASVLDKTGYTDLQIGLLKSPYSSRRLSAAGNLSLIASLNACRGLLFAAKDINRDIRILAIRALVQIRENTEILEQLKDDPDKKVRRYTLWAIERMKASQLP
ncbi:HEAT repeat domain-containing protein [Oceanispirochaeta crateris]|uniref:HEAT repeat domain-containing protein n=1 Tax=Oceanispirochaeta crateris TaxID=2518645 RepID=A0A5C1QIH7_9SPIO|nr:HEAT repeat domain-containing protein [Oceanispirochaeta crateris]QEN07267.1 HEAT repeat domain-containing protein [Oceanispirochaeta crateris]